MLCVVFSFPNRVMYSWYYEYFFINTLLFNISFIGSSNAGMESIRMYPWRSMQVFRYHLFWKGSPFFHLVTILMSNYSPLLECIPEWVMQVFKLRSFWLTVFFWYILMSNYPYCQKLKRIQNWVHLHTKTNFFNRRYLKTNYPIVSLKEDLKLVILLTFESPYRLLLRSHLEIDWLIFKYVTWKFLNLFFCIETETALKIIYYFILFAEMRLFDDWIWWG